ncbi:MAG TPA: metabolite traffic protein EboE [Kofleriaceae bacterium]|nr:metabolite traffic protein EboE [Kofleriaceae bacterium]
MRISLDGGRAAFLSYCANVHPGERLDDVWAALDAAAQVRAALPVGRLGLGLWLARSALQPLAADGGAHRLADEIDRRGLEVVTLNGFPYGNFHAEVVKRAVYHPDWCTPERAQYTRTLAEILATLLPPRVDSGTISTSPLAHRNEVSGSVLAFTARATDALCQLAADLARLRDHTGKRIRVCVEPEPGCLLESTRDAISWWNDAVPAAARRSGVPLDLAHEHLGVCFDTCHQAVAFEDAATSLEALAVARVPVGKMQLSSAIEVRVPGTPEGREALSRFAEQRFLHQVRAVGDDGRLAGIDDIYPDLEGLERLPQDRAWRVHYHAPIHRDAVGDVSTTRGFLRDAIAWLRQSDQPVPHLDVETYTWSVLPESERPGDQASLVAGIAAELRWARDELTRPSP